jgi:hypothetical protein
MNFLGEDLHRLIEEVLPVRFGGSPLDYQLVESEMPQTGLPQVVICVSPSVGKIDEAAVRSTVIQFLDNVPGAGGHFGQRWLEGDTLRVVRQQPFATGAGKVLALHSAGQSRPLTV